MLDSYLRVFHSDMHPPILTDFPYLLPSQWHMG